MKRRNTQKAKRETGTEQDGVFFLKLVMFLILGSQWLRVTNDAGALLFSLPVGLIIGVLFALHDHFRIDRKIEFAVILIAAMLGYYTMVGISWQI